MDSRLLTEAIWVAQTTDSVYNKKINNEKGESRKEYMADLNTVTITGRLTKDPEMKTTQSGKNVVSFSVAVNGYKEGDVSYIDVTAWEKTAELISKYFNKGSRILISGQLQQRSWEKDGKRQSKIEINVRDVVFIDPKKQTDSDNAPALSIDDTPVDLSSIPF